MIFATSETFEIVTGMDATVSNKIMCKKVKRTPSYNSGLVSNRYVCVPYFVNGNVRLSGIWLVEFRKGGQDFYSRVVSQVIWTCEFKPRRSFDSPVQTNGAILMNVHAEGGMLISKLTNTNVGSILGNNLVGNGLMNAIDLQLRNIHRGFPCVRDQWIGRFCHWWVAIVAIVKQIWKRFGRFIMIISMLRHGRCLSSTKQW